MTRLSRVLTFCLLLQPTLSAAIQTAPVELEAKIFAAWDAGDRETVKALLSEPGAAFARAQDGGTLLYKAAEKGDIELVQELLARNADSLALTRWGDGVLHAAARGGNLELVKLLLKEKGLHPNLQANYGSTPMHAAAASGNAELLRFLDSRGGDLKAVNNYGETLLHQAAQSGSLEAVRYLVEKGLNPGARHLSYRETPLHRAASAGKLDILKHLLEKRADISTLHDYGQTVLHMAAQSGNLEAVEYLLGKGLDIRAKDNYGQIPLHYAVSSGNLALVRHLAAQGPGIKETDAEIPLLPRTMVHGNLELIKYLVEQGCDPKKLASDGKNLLHSAYQPRKLDLLRYLVSLGLDPLARDNSGWTPLDYATWTSSPAVVKFFVEAGASLNDAPSTYYDSVALRLVSWADPEFFQYLEKKGADFKRKTKDGGTVLHMAAASANRPLLHYLLSRGYDAKAVTDKGDTLLHKAASSGHMALISDAAALGLDPRATNKKSETTLIQAAGSNLEAVRFFVEKGVDVNASEAEYQNTALSRAAGKLEMVKYLVEKGANLEAKPKYGGTALYEAAGTTNLDMVKYLVGRGADLNGTNYEGRNAAYNAAGNGSLEVLRYLADKGVDVKVRAKNGETALHYAAYRNQVENADYLLAHGVPRDAQDEYQEMPIHEAAYFGKIEMLRFLLDRGASIEAGDKYGRTPLFNAVRSGGLATAKFLVSRGANIRAVTTDGETVLHMTSNLPIARYLLEQGASLEVREKYGNTPLHRAASNDYVDMAKLLIERGASLSAQDNDGYTPLLKACSSGKLGMTRFLLEKGASLSTRNNNSAACLHLAAGSYTKNLDLIRLIVERGADVNAADKNGNTPLFDVLADTQSALYLLSRGAAPNVKNSSGETPLYKAAASGNAAVVQALIARGADANASTSDGTTPLYQASRYGHLALVQLLVAQGADRAAKRNWGGTAAEEACGYVWTDKEKCPKAEIAAFINNPPAELLTRIQSGLHRLDHLGDEDKARLEKSLRWSAGAGKLPQSLAAGLGTQVFTNLSLVAQRLIETDIKDFTGTAPQPPKLVQDKYERRAAFEARVATEKEKFEKTVREYNQRLRGYPAWRRNAVLEAALAMVFGSPKILKTDYDPEGQLFSVSVAADGAWAKDFSETFVLKEVISNERAAAFDEALSRSAPIVRFKASGASLVMVGAVFPVSGREYEALPAKEGVKRERQSVNLAALSKELEVAKAPPVPVQYAENPELAEKLKELEALRKKRAQRSELEALQRQIEELRQGEKPVVHSDVDEPSFKRPERPEDFALVMGIESYQQKELPAADFAERDAEAAARHLLALGVPRRNLKLLKGSDATLAQIRGYLDSWLAKNVGPDSRVYFYFSGHGAPDPKSKDAYLLPWDGNPAFLEKSAQPLKEVYASLERLKAKEVVVAMDACFSGAGGRSVLQKGTRPLVTVKVPSSNLDPKLSVFAASQEDEVTGSLDEQGHGIFTYYWLKGLGKGIKDTAGLCRYLKPQVQDASARQNRSQTPLCLGANLEF